MFRALARWCYRHRWTVVGLWIVALVGINVIGGIVGSASKGEFESPASESADGAAVLEEYFPGAGSGYGGSIVFQVADGTIARADVEAEMTTLFDKVDELEGVTVVSPYTPMGAQQVSQDQSTAFAAVNLDPTVDQTEATEIGQAIREEMPTIDGVRTEVGGAMLGEFEPPESELIGLAFAIVVLIVSFGSVLAMGLPIGVALAGVGAGGFGLVTLLSHVFSIPDFAPMIGLMIGLGVGIDYALFIVTRYRELVHAGRDPEAATVGAMDTAGRAVLFAGITVVVSLLGMLLIGLQFIAGLGIAAAATVAVTLIASITLLPALLGLTHAKIEVTRWRGLVSAGFVALALLGLGLGITPMAAAGAILAIATLVASIFVKPLREQVPNREPKPRHQTMAYRWSRTIQRRPWTFLLVGGGALLVMALPLFGLRFGFSDEGNFPEETTTRQAYDLIADGFGDGYNGPFVLAIEVDPDAVGDPAAMATIEEVAAAVAADPGVDRVSPPFPSDMDDPGASEAYLFQIIPTTSPQDEATADTVDRLRSDVISPITEGTGVDASLTGAVPTSVDFSDYLSGRMLVFFGAVLGVSFLLLMAVFRSILVPLKAVVMNVLSIAAAYGVVIAIFQWGWGGSVFGIEPGPIEPFVPMMLFAIVFGLSMDYEVFLLSRVKEEWVKTKDAKRSVADGLAATARVITAAAAIMVSVFGAFLLEDDRIIKLFGTGLALAVLLDATLVRMLLVPATMELLGDRNWWFPKWLDRIVPELNVEGPPPSDDSDVDDELDAILDDDDLVRS